MKLNVTPEWYEREAAKEENLYVTAGRPSLDPLIAETGALRPSLPQQKERGVAFGRLIHLRRREMGLSLEELADKTGIRLAELVCIERSQDYVPDPQTVYKLGEALSLPPSKLMQLSGLNCPEDRAFSEAAIRFAARSEPLERLSRAEHRALEEFVEFLSERDNVL